MRRPGRVAGLVILASYLCVAIFGGALFEMPRNALFAAYQKTMTRVRAGAPVVIVAIDEASLREIGQWPWPRQVMARLISRILAGHPIAVGVDILWPEPDRLSPREWMAQEGDLPPAVTAELRQRPDHDALLAGAIASGPVVVGIAGTREGGHGRIGKLTPVRLVGNGSAALTEILPSFTGTLRSLPVIDDAASGHGMMSVDLDDDGMVRAMPLLSAVAGQIAPSLDLEMLRIAAGASWIDAYGDGRAVRGVAVGPLAIPTQADGRVWIDFTAHDGRRFVSASDILANRAAADSFDHRLVLVGVTGLGLIDQQETPLGRMPGIEVHAQLLENILDGRLAIRPGWAPITEPAATLLLGLILVTALPRLRLRWHAPLLVLVLAALMTAGFLLWRFDRLLVDAATPAIGEGAVFVGLLGGGLAEADAHRRKLRREIELRKIEAARIEGELEAARRIQMGILPSPSTLAPDGRFDLAARIIPAREVGGDLYEFFKIDDDRLYLAIGDVSGKGVPASLFMALGKALCKSSALRGDEDIGVIIGRANAEISRDNSEMLFITMFAGILDLATGELRFCNAGHDAPFLLRPGQAPHPVNSTGGPPLCVMDDFPYATETLRLEEGDMICLTTDGVTEAMDRNGALMGRQRVDAALAALPAGTDAVSAIEAICRSVEAFVAGAEPSDDLTVLAARWTGPRSSISR